MNIEKVKSYSSSIFTDKNKNPININDILLSSNKLCIYLKNTNNNRILVGFNDGKISSVNPNKLIRVDYEIENLKKYFLNLSKNAEIFDSYKRKTYYTHTIYITKFYEQYRNKSKRLLSNRLKNKTVEFNYKTLSPINKVLYILNGKYYHNKFSDAQEILIDEPYIFQSPLKGNVLNPNYAFCINSFEYDLNKVLNLNKDKIINLLINEINTNWN